MKFSLTVTAATLGLSLLCHAHAADLASEYPGPWRDTFDSAITGALARNSVRGCGEYKWRPSPVHKGEFLVYCSRDGKNWLAYQVWTGTNKITGPFQPSASIPP